MERVSDRLAVPCAAALRLRQVHISGKTQLDARRFEELLMDLFARFNGSHDEDVEGEIDVWLRRFVEFLGVDRSSFAQINSKGVIETTHAYSARGIPPALTGAMAVNWPWLVGELTAGRAVIVERIPGDFPAEAVMEREYCQRVGMRSAIALPVQIDQSVVCVLSFSAFREERAWPAELVPRLYIVASVFANALVRRTSKQRLEQKQKELAHFGRVAAMGELASVIAHELDQPLTAVVSNAQAVRYMLDNGESDSAEVDEALKDVIDAAMRLSEIVQRERRLLKKSEVDVIALDLNEIIRDIELFIRAEARQERARLVLELVPGLPMVKGDRVQLQQVILNLARNGFQAMGGSPRENRVLTMRTSAQSGEVVLTVSDAGPAIEDEQLQQMFDPFYSTKKDGLGMGLSISKTIVESLGGKMWATRNAAPGITMHVSLPQIREQAHVVSKRCDGVGG